MSESQWFTWGASVTGPAHLRLGLPNQDAWLARHFDWGEVVVVADGLGSRPKADVGAQAVCRAVVAVVEANPTGKIEDLLESIHAHWLACIVPLAPSDCLTTCLFAVRYGEHCLLARLGDGAIVLCANDPQESMVLSANNPELFSNQTDALGATLQLQQWQSKVVDLSSFHAIVLCTDGIADDLQCQSQIPFAQDLVAAYRDIDAIKRDQELQQWLNDWPVPGHTDDKTLVCLYHKEID
jgi:serine/threonine protein phosphatase PrpC